MCISRAFFAVSLICLVSCQNHSAGKAQQTIASPSRDQSCPVTGFIPEPVCAHSFVEVVSGQLTDGPAVLYGYLVKREDGYYVFATQEAASSNLYKESVFLTELSPDLKDQPDLFLGKLVQVVGYYSRASHEPHVDVHFSDTSGTFRDIDVRFNGKFSMDSH